MYRLRRDVKAASVCVQLNGAGAFYKTVATIKVSPPRVASVGGLRKSALGQAMTFDVSGVGLVSELIQVKIVAKGQSCTGNTHVIGGSIRNVSGIHSSSMNGTIQFDITDMSSINGSVGSFRLCTRVPSVLLGGDNIFVERHTFDVAATLGMRPIEVGLNVLTAMTLSVVHVSKNGGDQVTFTDKDGNCPSDASTAGVEFSTDGSGTIMLNYTFQTIGTVYACLKVSGTNMYQKQSATVVEVKKIEMRRLTPERVIKNQPFVFDTMGLGVGSHVKLKVVGEDTSCTQSPLGGGSATSFSVATNSLNTNARVPFTLQDSAVDAKVCALFETINGGSGSWLDTKFRITIVGVSEMSPSVLAEDVQTTSELTHVGVDVLKDELFIAATEKKCVEQDTVVGGELIKLKEGSLSTFKIQNTLTNGVLCIKVNGTSFTTGVAVTVIEEGKNLMLRGPTYIPVGVETQFNLTGIGVHDDYYIKWVAGASAQCSDINHNEHAVGGGEGQAVQGSTVDTSFATAKFTFTSPATVAYACVLLPTGYTNQTKRIHVVRVDDVQPNNWKERLDRDCSYRNITDTL